MPVLRNGARTSERKGKPDVPRQLLDCLVARVLLLRFSAIMKYPSAQGQDESGVERMADAACVSVALMHNRHGPVRVAQHP